MAAPQDNCWLCNKFGRMTKEHIPQESAFNQSIPPDVGIFLFGSNCRGSRRTGIASHIDLTQSSQFNVVGEFSFWPLGTVISFGNFSHPGLIPIHHWAQYSFDYKGTVD